MKENRSYLRELGPVKGFVALEELSCQVAVLPVHFLQSRSMASMVQREQNAVFNEIKIRIRNQNQKIVLYFVAVVHVLHACVQRNALESKKESRTLTPQMSLYGHNHVYF